MLRAVEEAGGLWRRSAGDSDLLAQVLVDICGRGGASDFNELVIGLAGDAVGLLLELAWLEDYVL